MSRTHSVQDKKKKNSKRKSGSKQKPKQSEKNRDAPRKPRVKCKKCVKHFARLDCKKKYCLNCCSKKSGKVCPAHEAFQKEKSTTESEKGNLEPKASDATVNDESNMVLAKGSFAEDAIQDFGETVTLWCLRDFLRNPTVCNDVFDNQVRALRAKTNKRGLVSMKNGEVPKEETIVVPRNHLDFSSSHAYKSSRSTSSIISNQGHGGRVVKPASLEKETKKLPRSSPKISSAPKRSRKCRKLVASITAVIDSSETTIPYSPTPQKAIQEEISTNSTAVQNTKNMGGEKEVCHGGAWQRRTKHFWNVVYPRLLQPQLVMMGTK